MKNEPNLPLGAHERHLKRKFEYPFLSKNDDALSQADILNAHQKDAKEYINKTFSSYKSGIINPEVDKNWKEKVDKYMDYIVNKRETYKNWFLADK